jgi:hypothetical protein
MSKMKVILMFLGMINVCCLLQAQNAGIENEFQQIRAAYEKLPYLSYQVQYLYAKEQAPGIYIDTVNGRYLLHGKKYYGMLDSVEYVQNDSLFIALYPEEQVILLNSAAPSALQANTNWDSIWKQQKENMQVTMTKEGEFTKFDMRFAGDSTYKKIELWYNSKTKLMHAMKYIMREPQELNENDDEDNEQTTQEQPFVIIEARFTNYSTAPFDRAILQTERYVQKRDKEYQPSVWYKDYTVLIGSPGLLK